MNLKKKDGKLNIALERVVVETRGPLESFHHARSQVHIQSSDH